MRRLLFLLLFPAALFGQSHEILRPTVDSNSSTTAIGCSGTNQSAAGMTLSYDATGLATRSQQFVAGSTSQTHYKVRIFKTWGASTQTYTALTLNVNSSSTGDTGGGGFTANVALSLNSGSTWSFIRSSGSSWAQTTDTISLSTAQDMTKLQVAICVEGDSEDPAPSGAGTLSVWDIWTDGTFSGAAAGTGSSVGTPATQPLMISFLIPAYWRRRIYK